MADNSMATLTNLCDTTIYEQAKPHFIKAASKFGAFVDDIHKLVGAMVRELKDARGWTREMLDEAEPYFRKFVDEVMAGDITREDLLAKRPPEEGGDTRPGGAGKGHNGAGGNRKPNGPRVSGARGGGSRSGAGTRKAGGGRPGRGTKGRVGGEGESVSEEPASRIEPDTPAANSKYTTTF